MSHNNILYGLFKCSSCMKISILPNIFSEIFFSTCSKYCIKIFYYKKKQKWVFFFSYVYSKYVKNSLCNLVYPPDERSCYLLSNYNNCLFVSVLYFYSIGFLLFLCFINFVTEMKNTLVPNLRKLISLKWNY